MLRAKDQSSTVGWAPSSKLHDTGAIADSSYEVNFQKVKQAGARLSAFYCKVDRPKSIRKSNRLLQLENEEKFLNLSM